MCACVFMGVCVFGCVCVGGGGHSVNCVALSERLASRKLLILTVSVSADAETDGTEKDAGK